MSLKNWALAPSAVVLATAAALLGAPNSAAEPRDDFLDTLNTLNIVMPWQEQADTVAAGYQVCTELRGGTSVLDEMDLSEQRYGLPSGQGTLFVGAATTNLCPDWAG